MRSMIRKLLPLFLVLLSVASAAQAADPAAEATAQPAAEATAQPATQPAAQPASQPAAQSATAPDPAQLVLDDLHERLTRFADQWLATLRRNELSGPGHCEISRGADGRYVARYQHIQEGIAPVCVVQASELKPGAYIGSIRYKVETLECSGDTPQDAKAGPFQVVSCTLLNEIFSIQSKDAPWSAPR